MAAGQQTTGSMNLATGVDAAVFAGFLFLILHSWFLFNILIVLDSSLYFYHRSTIST